MDFDEHLTDLHPEPTIATLLRDLASRRGVVTGRKGGYVSARSPGRRIAAYFNRSFVDIATDPLTSGQIGVRVHAEKIIAKSNATHYVRVRAADVHRGVVLEEVVSAVDWREQGPRWSGAARGTDQE